METEKKNKLRNRGKKELVIQLVHLLNFYSILHFFSIRYYGEFNTSLGEHELRNSRAANKQ